MLRRVARVGGACAGLLLLSGCATFVAGSWTLQEARPNREVFAIERLDLRPDETFAATITREGRTRDEAGRWERRPNTLRLRPESGGVLEFSARQRGDTLELRVGDQRVTLRRSER
jgi:hypothetical protein